MTKQYRMDVVIYAYHISCELEIYLPQRLN
jgi:hypothetical protein